ncbi:hypothetical protein L0F63_004280 [Massospora cicadina]|nr:hypothetical protein L0F63_004280 [Massospora cicadina]
MNKVKTWQAGDLDPKVNLGDVVDRLGIRFVWTTNHRTGREMLDMTLKADPLADEAIPLLKGKGIQAIQDFISTDNCPLSWVDMDQIRRGQEFYWETFHDNGRILMNHSLISDFAVSSIVRVLTCTGYLANPKSAYRRGVETAYMVSSAMERTQLVPWGRGWRSVVGVRLMHAQARQHATRVSKRSNRPLLGVAINQQDLMFTLLLFSVTVILGYDKLGVKYTTQQRDDYMATFRYIGYLIGVDDPNNQLANFTTALALKQSLDVYLIQPNKESAHMTKVVLQSFQYNPPFFLSFRHHVQLVRLLMGESLANELQLPYRNSGMDWGLKLTMYRQNKLLELMLHLHRGWGLNYLEKTGEPAFSFTQFNPEADYSIELDTSLNPLVILALFIFVLFIWLGFNPYPLTSWF